jgi:hypothetical protein
MGCLRRSTGTWNSLLYYFCSAFSYEDDYELMILCPRCLLQRATLYITRTCCQCMTSTSIHFWISNSIQASPCDDFGVLSVVAGRYQVFEFAQSGIGWLLRLVHAQVHSDVVTNIEYQTSCSSRMRGGWQTPWITTRWKF